MSGGALSGDTSPGDEEAAIRSVISPEMELKELVEEAEAVLADLNKALKSVAARKTKTKGKSRS